MISVLIADDQALMRSGLRMIVDAQDDMTVSGEAADGAEAVAAAGSLHPDVVLMDVRMPNLDGIEATLRITRARPRTKVLVLTTFDLDESVYAAIRAGASGFLLKDTSPANLAHAIRVTASGDALLGPSITRRLLNDFVQRPHPGADRPVEVADLSDRELEVLRLIARGLTNQEIGQRLYVSESTVKTHITRILSKLHLRDRVHAVVLAYEIGLVRPGDPIDAD